MSTTLYYELYEGTYRKDKHPSSQSDSLTAIRADAYHDWKKRGIKLFTIVRVYNPYKRGNVEFREEYGELFVASAPHPKTLWFNAYGRAGTFTYGEVLPNGKGIQYKP